MNPVNIFLQKSCMKWYRETGSRPLFVFQKNVYTRYKQVACILVSIYFNSPRLGHTYKNVPYKTLHCWFRYMLNFNFLEKGLGLVFPPHFAYHFSRKMIYCIRLPEAVVQRCSVKKIILEFHKIHMKTPMPGSLF